jgi:hypothetical protein
MFRSAAGLVCPNYDPGFAESNRTFGAHDRAYRGAITHTARPEMARL